ncbi:hypothetical protein Trydic_g22670 [Trypoxylus dichotomus]
MASANTSAGSQKQSVPSSSCSRKTDSESERRRSCETVCSSNSSCFLQKRKAVHPLAASLRTHGTKNPNNAVKQRVLSAKLLKLKSVQSQLNDANFHLAELMKENRALRTLQKRQDKALKNYEGVNADLPRLIKGHEDEMRVLQERNKLLRKALKEAQEQLKVKDEEINTIRSQLRHLHALTKDKHLGEREKLKEELEEVKEKLRTSESQINLLNRRLMLESKNAKFKLNNEIVKHKQCQKELTQALTELNRLNGTVELNDVKQPVSGRKRSNLPQRQSMSCVSLGSGSSPENNDENLMADSSPNIKLEPIANKKEETSDIQNSILKSPEENIKARLSSAILRRNSIAETNQINNKLKKLNIDEGSERSTKNQHSKSIYTVSSNNLSRSNSSHKLEILVENFQTSLQRPSNKEIDQRLGDYCLNVVNSVKSISSVVDQHKANYNMSQTETQRLLEQLKQADVADSKLRQNKLVEEFNVPKEDLEIVNKIWLEEYNFQKNKEKNMASTQEKGLDRKVKRESNVAQEEKKNKLLATLRAIDNGEVVENMSDALSRKTKVLNHLIK